MASPRLCLDRDAIHSIAREYRPNATDNRDVAQPEFILGPGCAMGYRMLDPRYDVTLIIGGIGTMVMFFTRDQSQRPVFPVGASPIILGAALKEEKLGGLFPMALVGLKTHPTRSI
jgi:hypothetical protein